MAEEVDLVELEQLHLKLVTTRTPEEGWLTLHTWDQPRELHRWGFENPTADAQIFEGRIDVALVPGAVFDVAGRRLGHGKGYYDELLARIDAPVKIGVAPKQLVVPRLPQDSHDVIMTHLVTEAGVENLRSDQGVPHG
jgi:5-formyltetrahydrofolate cyclo-ligase